MIKIHKRIKYRINKIIRTTLLIFLSIFSIVMISFIIISSTLEYRIPPLETILLYDEENTLIASCNNGKKKRFVRLNDLSDNTINAFLTIEDKRFFDHDGLDFIRIIKATLVDLVKMKPVEGASTITQQYARNLFLTFDKTWKRKLAEMMIALNLEMTYSKEEILEGYLNSIYFGSGIYGIEDATGFYFHKESKDLTLKEACMLASIPKGPSIYSPINCYEQNIKRAHLILHELLEDNLINLDEYHQSINEDVKIYGSLKENSDEYAPYFQDYCLQELRKIEQVKPYLDKGVKVITTLDLEYAKACGKIDDELVSTDIESTSVTIEPSTGKIKMLSGGCNYHKSTYNRCISSQRMIASTVKPFLYLGALEHGFNVATTFRSEKTVFLVDGKEYAPENYNQAYPNTDVSMIYALATSDNMYALKTHLFLGMNVLKNTLIKLGLTKDFEINASSALGSISLTNLQLASLYQVLANEGVKINPYVISKVYDLNDRLIYEHKPQKASLIDKSNVYILNEAMTSIFDHQIYLVTMPTGVSIKGKLKHKICGKSGSTDYDYWMVGYNKDVLVTVWSGYDDNRIILKKEDKVLSKYKLASLINAYLENKNTTWYEKPNDVVGININPINGFYASFDDYSKTCYFRKDNIPWYIELLEGFI